MKSFLKIAAGTVLALAAMPASAAPILLDGGWEDFVFDDVGSSFDRTFEFTLSGTARFNITDAFLNGDQFEIFLNGVSQGLTSAGANDGTYISDYDQAFASPKFSRASYLLGPGTYSISGIATSSPYQSGSGAASLVSATAAVPEPATWAMMLAGFGAVGFAMRRRETGATRLVPAR